MEEGVEGEADEEKVTDEIMMDLSYPQTTQCCRSDPEKMKSFDLHFPQTPSTAHTSDIPSGTCPKHTQKSNITFCSCHLNTRRV